tara:strand:- start:58 stop:711 length:654 start_codon:yes stop_codon:yes gene_type:complete
MLEDFTDSLPEGTKRGPELPPVNPKLVLEATNTSTAALALQHHGKDLKSHRPHYIIDPNEFKIYKILNTSCGVTGDFHSSQPQWSSRCVFVSIVKEDVISLTMEQEKSVGRLLKILCDIEAVPAVVYEGGALGTHTFGLFQGIVSWSCMPDGRTTPGPIDWTNLNEGLHSPDPIEEALADLSSLTVAELKKIAVKAGISHRNLRKADLIQEIETAYA